VEKEEVLGRKPVQLSLCPQQISHGLVGGKIRSVLVGVCDYNRTPLIRINLDDEPSG